MRFAQQPRTHVLAVSTLTDSDGYWNALKQAHGRLPRGASWTLAVASTDGSTAVNIVAHDSVDSVREFLEEFAAPYATTTYLEADAANAVGLAV
ncbi:hypothetical protein GPX89_41755 [Nocardia sp. ET3-3]|uniref:Uncharacterized protein n=1 Tax=Nocardia terrae TaxID=2675851 RepID=A0A7K1VBA1_9NOCA|nr:hypothetical protein [Nocardia terrae]MVU83749.1 hypothetical protein [Nocardia terrae]